MLALQCYMLVLLRAGKKVNIGPSQTLPHKLGVDTKWRRLQSGEITKWQIIKRQNHKTANVTKLQNSKNKSSNFLDKNQSMTKKLYIKYSNNTLRNIISNFILSITLSTG